MTEGEGLQASNAASDAQPTGQGAAWLMLAVGDDRQHGGNDGYDDRPATHYSWDDTVPNHAAISVGDSIALWDKRFLLGASVIEEIEHRRETKSLHRCPECGLARIKSRKTKSPRFKCYACKAEFDEPVTQVTEVTTYRSRHDVGWVDLSGCLTGPELRELCVHRNSQLSLRPLDWTRFERAVAHARGGEPLRVVRSRAGGLRGGHRTATVRVRLGQASFRRSLLARFGSVCALTGPAPASALEACHLYSYATLGEHRAFGGLLLRRDIHRLFDLGYLVVNPETSRISVGEALLRYPGYAELNGCELAVPVTASHRRWLAEHWTQYRGS